MDLKADTGVVGEFAPFVGSKDGVGWGDGGAGIEKLDFACGAANHQLGFGDGAGKVGDLAWEGLLRFLPEGCGGG